MNKLDEMYYSITVQQPDMLKTICSQYLVSIRNSMIISTVETVIHLIDKTMQWGTLSSSIKERVICFMYSNAEFFIRFKYILWYNFTSIKRSDLDRNLLQVFKEA